MVKIIGWLNPVLRGWYGYFKHGLTSTLQGTDQWVRRRLRNLLRKRDGRSGASNGEDNHRYPNAYFANLGLFSLRAAKTFEVQSRS